MSSKTFKNVQQNEGGEDWISPAQEKVLFELLKGATQRDAAVAGNVTEHTVGRWMRSDPIFIAAYNQARASMMDAAVNEIIKLRKAAVEALRDLVTDAAPENQWIRLKAAQTVLRIDIPKIGPTDPVDVEIELSSSEREREISRIVGGY